MKNILMNKKIVICFAACIFLMNVSTSAQLDSVFIRKNFEFARKQYNSMLGKLDPAQLLYPRSIDSTDKLTTTGMTGWTSGFFPGCLWYVGDYFNDKNVLASAETWTRTLEP